MREMARVPRVTYALIAINVLVFLAEKGQFTIYGSSVHGFLIDEGILFREAIAAPYDQYWRLVTNAFLHENFLHLGFNMYILYLVGVMLEPAIGSLRFAVIYAAGLLAGSLGVVIWSNAASLGASGAIFGLLGAAVIDVRGRGHRIAETGLGTLIVLNLILTFLIPNISIGAHIGGLIGGTLAALAFREADKRGWPALGMIAGLVICAASVAGSILVASAATGTGFA